MAGNPVDVYCAGGITTAFPVGVVLLCGGFAIGADAVGRVKIKPIGGGQAFAEPVSHGVKLVTRVVVQSEAHSGKNILNRRKSARGTCFILSKYPPGEEPAESPPGYSLSFAELAVHLNLDHLACGQLVWDHAKRLARRLREGGVE